MIRVLAFLLVVVSCWGAACSNTAYGNSTCIQSTAFVSTAGSPATIACPAINVGSNHTIVAYVVGGTISTITLADTAGASYTTPSAGANTQSSAAGGLGTVFISWTNQSIANASDVVTATITSSSGTARITCQEWSGIPTSSALDVACVGSATSTNPSATCSTTNANDILLGFAIDSQTLSAGTSFILDQTANTSKAADEIEAVSSSGSQSIAFSAASGGWGLVGVAFKQSAAAASPHGLPTLGAGHS